MNFTQSARYLRLNPLFYILSLATGIFAVWWWVMPPFAILAVIFSVLLVALALIDAKHTILPNSLVGALAAFGLLFAITEAAMFSPPDASATILVLSRVTIALFAMAAMLGMGWLGKMVAKREAMGMGDVKMVGAITLWVNLDGLLIMLLISSLLALPWALYSIARRLLKHQKPSSQVIPFGPYLAVGAWVSFMFRSIIWALLMMGGI